MLFKRLKKMVERSGKKMRETWCMKSDEKCVKEELPKWSYKTLFVGKMWRLN